jgi:hypothetical protein
MVSVLSQCMPCCSHRVPLQIIATSNQSRVCLSVMPESQACNGRRTEFPHGRYAEFPELIQCYQPGPCASDGVCGLCPIPIPPYPTHPTPSPPIPLHPIPQPPQNRCRQFRFKMGSLSLGHPHLDPCYPCRCTLPLLALR